MNDDLTNDSVRGFVKEYRRQVQGYQQATPLPKPLTKSAELGVSPTVALSIIRTKRYQHREELSLILEAREYVKGRLPVRDRAMAVAIL